MTIYSRNEVNVMAEFNKKWLHCALIRAVKTVCQTAIATIGTASVLSAVDWRMVLSASVLAGILSMLTSVAGLPEADEPYEEDKGPIFYEDDDDGESGV